jgi:hypothetical protein
MTTSSPSRRLRHAPADWMPGLTRVRDVVGDNLTEPGELGTFVRNSHPLPGVSPTGWLGVLIRFDGTQDLLDVDPSHLEVVCLRDPFAAVRATLPTRYAPGATGVPYDYPTLDAWYPVIYYPAGTIVAGEGPIWLVEPYPAERADGSDGLDPVTSAGVAVLRGIAAPRPRGTTYRNFKNMTADERADCDGDWIIPGRALANLTAYDAHVTNQADLLAAWVEAWAIAATLNHKISPYTSLRAADIEPLLAAERHALISHAGAPGASYQHIGAEPDELLRVPDSQLQRLRGGFAPLIRPTTAGYTGDLNVEEGAPSPAWLGTTYGLTSAGKDVLKMIRTEGFEFGGPRCRVCGCTEDRACDGGCSWLTLGPGGPLCSACPAVQRRR